jgi:hypothetical protein
MLPLRYWYTPCTGVALKPNPTKVPRAMSMVFFESSFFDKNEPEDTFTNSVFLFWELFCSMGRSILGVFCPMGRFVLGAFLSLGSFCFGSFFVPWNVLFLELFVPWDVLFWGRGVFLHCWSSCLVTVQPAGQLSCNTHTSTYTWGGGGVLAKNPKSDNCSISECSSANYATG